MQNFKTYLLFLAAMFCCLHIQAHVEKLTRGIVAMHKSNGNYITWRLLGTDTKGTTFDLQRDGKTIATGLAITSYTDATGTTDSKYRITTKDASGNIVDTSVEATAWDTNCKLMKLDRPTGGSFSYTANQFGRNQPTYDSIGYYSYYAQEASVGDVDGDGEYEMLIKWQPNCAKDNSSSGLTPSVFYDCYRLNPATGNEDASAQKLWRIELGINIRAGSHYSQPMFYDFDGDGCAELICKTGPGTIDGEGRYVSEAADDETIRSTDNTADYRNKNGHVMDGAEFLSVFDGKTGRAIHTIWYNPNRGFSTGRVSGYASWGDDYGNRGERYLACVAYLDGLDKNPSAVMCRGYYTRSYLWAVDFDGAKLKQKWLHASVSKTRVEVTDANGHKTVSTYNSNTSGKGDCYTAYGQGCHSIACGDVDGDGCDEIIYGSAAIDNDGSLLYSTGLGHGDAHHLADLYPDRPGLEFMMPHEESGNGWSVRDAATGELLIWRPSSGDNGRGMAADIDPAHRGYEFWSAADRNVYNTSEDIISSNKRPAYCFRIYWDGTLNDNLLDGVNITSYSNGANTRIFQASGCIKNGSKAYPVLSADLFGDWREELILCDATDSCTLHIFSTTNETKFAVPTLMHDHLYRMSVCWQNVAYNQPPHLSYYLPDMFASRFDVIGEGLKEQTVTLGKDITPIVCQLTNCTSAMVYASYLDGQRIKSFGVPDGFNFSIDRTLGQFTISGTPTKTGVYEIIIRSSGDISDIRLEDTIRITVTNTDAIVNVPFTGDRTRHSNKIYDMLGREVNANNLTTGLYIMNNRKYVIK